MFISATTQDRTAPTTSSPIAPPPLADMTGIVRSWTDLPDLRRRDLASAVAAALRICAVPDRDAGPDDPPPPPPVMSCAYLNARLFRDAPAAYGIRSPERFANILSQLRFALRRLSAHETLASERSPLTPAWERLHATLPTEHRRLALGSFMRFCSSHGIAPQAVTAGTLAGFEEWRRQRTLCDDVAARAQAVASNWTWARSHVLGWPDVALERPRMNQHYTLPFTAYPPALQADAKRFLDRLACGDPGDIFPDDAADRSGPRSRLRALRPRTIATRDHQLRQCLAAMVLGGRDPASITSLRDMVDPPEQAHAILTFFVRRAGNKRTSQTGAIGELLRQVARFHCRLDAAAVETITRWSRNAAPKLRLAISGKNMRRLQALMQPRIRHMLLNLPLILLREAADEQLRPRDAALLAMYAAALDLLLAFPMRRSNLAALRLDRHLQRLDPKTRLLDVITLSEDETKTGKAMLWPLPPEVATRLQTYLDRHRPHLAAHGNPYLFPNTGMGGRSAHDIAVELTKLVERRLGCEFNLHLVRHFVVALHLEHHPGQYETARHLLGHARSSYTIAVYDGLGTAAAAKQLDATLKHERSIGSAVPAHRPPRRPQKPGRGV